MKNYTEILRSCNLKATPQRLVILESIDTFGHINVDKLYEEVKSKFNSISLATIYKNINSMINNTLLLEVKIPNEKSVYEMVKDQHSHLVHQLVGPSLPSPKAGSAIPDLRDHWQVPPKIFRLPLSIEWEEKLK